MVNSRTYPPMFGAMVLLTVHVVERIDPRYSAAGLIVMAVFTFWQPDRVPSVPRGVLLAHLLFSMGLLGVMIRRNLLVDYKVIVLAVEESHVQVLFQLRQRLAGGLWADVQRSGGLAQTAEFGGRHVQAFRGVLEVAAPQDR